MNELVKGFKTFSQYSHLVINDLHVVCSLYGIM